MPTYHFGPFEAGPNTLWLGAHGLCMILVLAGLAFLAGAISLASRADDRLVSGLKTASVLTLLAFVALTFTGLVPDVLFENGAGFSGTFQNAFGTFHANVSDENLGALTGPLLFDIMEHVPLVLPGLAAFLCFCIWQYGRRVVDDASVRASVLSLLAVTFVWVLAVGGIGVYVSKVLTFPYIR